MITETKLYAGGEVIAEMKTIKIIDLLNKIANGVNIPIEINYKDITYRYDCDTKDYYSGLNDEYLFDEYVITDILNDEVEILDEEYKETKPITKEDIEAVGYACGEIKKAFENGWNKSLEEPKEDKIKKVCTCNEHDMTPYEELHNPTDNEKILMFKINELIDEVNKLKEE